MNTAYCFITDGGDWQLHQYAVTELKRHIPDARCITVSDGGYSNPLPFQEVVDARPEFERVFGAYEPHMAWTRFPPLCFARFLLPSILAGRFDRIVYLDNDAIVVSPEFASIAEQDLSGFDVGACPDVDETPKRIMCLRGKTGCDGIMQYCNSGVLLMRGSPGGSMESKVADGYREHIARHLTLPDQDVMNWKLRVKRMQNRYNSMVTAGVGSDACCIHYSGGTKRWMLPLITGGLLKWTFCS